MVSDNKKVANTFNEFLTNKAQTLANHFGPAKANQHEFLTYPIQECFFISPVDSSEAECELMSLDESKMRVNTN